MIQWKEGERERERERTYSNNCLWEHINYLLSQFLPASWTKPNIQLISLTIFGLELLWSTETAKVPIDHDTHPSTQSLTLSHTVCGQ